MLFTLSTLSIALNELSFALNWLSCNGDTFDLSCSVSTGFCRTIGVSSLGRFDSRNVKRFLAGELLIAKMEIETIERELISKLK
jgi:hypothetical protein